MMSCVIRSLTIFAVMTASFSAPLFAQEAATVPADTTAPNPTITTLSAAQKAELNRQSTEASVDAARAGARANDALSGNAGPDRQIHGEVGAMVGTNGARGVFGTAAVPIGDTGGAVISFENSRYGRLR